MKIEKLVQVVVVMGASATVGLASCSSNPSSTSSSSSEDGGSGSSGSDHPGASTSSSGSGPGAGSSATDLSSGSSGSNEPSDSGGATGTADASNPADSSATSPPPASKGGGNPGPVSTVPVSVNPPAAPASCGSGICVRQTAEVTHGDDNPEKDVLPFGQPVLAGSTVIVFAYDMNINGNPIASGTPYPIVITDSANGTYKKLITVNDPIGWADNQIFARTNVSAGTLTVTGAWMTNQWHSLIIAEVAHVSTSPSITAAGVLNASASTQQDAVSSGTLAMGASPALLLGYAVNNIDSVGEAGAPWAGTGFTTVTTGANWQGKEGTSSNPAAILESAYFATGGRVAANFTSKKPVGSADNFVAIGIAVQ